MRLFSSAVVLLLALLVSSLSFAQEGNTLFKSKCAMCHGPDGAAQTTMGKKLGIRDLHSPAVQKQSDAELTQIIEKGKAKMPAFEGKLTKEQAAALVAYIRELEKQK